MKKQVEKMQAEITAAQVNLRDQLVALPKEQQEAVASYFASYNLTAWLFNQVLSEDAKQYVEKAVELARQTRELEDAMQNVFEPADVEKVVNDLNDREEYKIHSK